MDRMKKRIFNIWFILIFVLFLLPYLGGVGELVFAPLGKYYYAGLFCVCAANFACRFFFLKQSINFKYVRYLKNIREKTSAKIVCACVLALAACFFLFGYSMQNRIFGIVLIGCFAFFATYRYDETLLDAVAVAAALYLYFIFIASVFGGNFSYFNSNSYALITTALLFFTALHSKKTRFWWIIFAINAAIAVYTAQIIYKSETQLLSVLFFIGLFVFRKKLLSGGCLTKLLLCYVFAFTVLLPFVSYGLLRAGVLPSNFLSSRAICWRGTIDKIFESGLFSAAGTDAVEAYAKPHNGFLDVAYKYTLPTAALFIACLMLLYWRLSDRLQKNSFRQTVFAIILSYVLMNSVESVFVGLSDGYFLLFFSGILLSDVVSDPTKEGEIPPVFPPTSKPKRVEPIAPVRQEDGKKGRSIAENAVAKAILNICNIIIPVIVGPYVLRVLDRDYYDLYNSLNSVFQFFLIFGALGIYNYGVREISKIRNDREKCDVFFTEQFLIGVVSNAVVLCVYVVTCFTSESDALSRNLCLVMSAQLFGNVFNVEWINEANEDYFFIAIKSILIKIAYFAGIFVLVRRCDDIIAYVALLTASSVLNTAASFVHIKKRYKFNFKGIRLHRHLFPILNTFIIANVMLFYAQFDKLMLRWFAGNSSVTAYQNAQYISYLFYSVVIAVVTVTIPRMSNMFGEGRIKEAHALHQSSSNLFLMIMIPLTVGLFLLAREVIYLYGGAGYADCIQPLKAYSVLQLVSGFHYMVGEAYIYIRGDEKVLLVINLCGAALNVGLNFLCLAFDVFVPVTAVLTLVTAYVVISVIDIIFVRKKYGYFYSVLNKNTLLYLCTAAAFVPIVYVLRLTGLSTIPLSVLCVLACASVYFIVLVLFKDVYLTKLLCKIKKIIARFLKKGER